MQCNPNSVWNRQDGIPVMYPVQVTGCFCVARRRTTIAAMGLLASAPPQTAAPIQAAHSWPGCLGVGLGSASHSPTLRNSCHPPSLYSRTPSPPHTHKHTHASLCWPNVASANSSLPRVNGSMWGLAHICVPADLLLKWCESVLQHFCNTSSQVQRSFGNPINSLDWAHSQAWIYLTLITPFSLINFPLPPLM